MRGRMWGIGAVALAISGAGCRVTDAPETLEELVVFGFENFERDDDFLISMGVELFPLVDADFEDISDGYRVNNLTAEQMEAAGVEDADVVEIIGAMGACNYRHTIADLLVPILAPNRDEMFEQILEYDVTSETVGGRDCFIAGECDEYRFTATQTVQVPLLGESTQDVDAAYRWVRPDDAEPFVVLRILSPEGIQFNSDIMRVRQQYSLAVLYPFEDTARRVESFWVDAEIIGADLPDYFAVDQAAGSMNAQAERVDDWLDAESGISTEE